jgi:TIR domain/CHASE2 domain
VNPIQLRELARTVLIAVAIALVLPLALKGIGPFSDHPVRVLAVLIPLAVVIAVLGWPAYRDERVLLGGGFLAFFLGFCLLFSIAAGSDLLAGRRTPLIGYEQEVPRSFLGLNRLGDWRYALVAPKPRIGTDTLVFTLEPSNDVGLRRREFAWLIQQAITRRTRGIAFDFYFEERSDVDPLLCDVVGRAASAKLPVYFGYKHSERDGLLVHDPLPETLACLEGHLASLAGLREADLMVRMLPVYFQHDPNDESLSLKVARHLAGGTLELPESGLLQFTRPASDRDPMPGMPTQDQLRLFENRFVFVGSARAGDVHDTPFGRLPGVKIHELAARSLAQSQFIERLRAGWTFPLIFALCFVLSVAQARGVGPRRLCAIGLVLIVATVALAAAAIRFALVWVDVSYLVAAIGSMTGLLLAGSAIEQQRRNREAVVRGALVPASGNVAAERRIIDVFLSHNGRDKVIVRELAEALQARGLDAWLDEWELVPGRPWQEALEEVIKTTRSAAVLVGPDGLGPWEEPEMRACLEQAVRRSMPVIPVLLPGSATLPTLPPFLERFTWVDLRAGLDQASLDRLEWGITGVKPRGSGASRSTRAAHSP